MDNDILYESILESAQYLKEKMPVIPSHAIVLGTGLGNMMHGLEIIKEIAYRFIPHFVPTTVESHQGKLILAKWQNKPILIFSGRMHYYEGYNLQEVTYPIRVLNELGVKTIWITNASGAVNPDLKAGEIVFVEDHINFHPENPLRGISDPRLGDRFPDMSKVYDIGFLKLAKTACDSINYPFRKMIYFGLQGPSLETPAEYRMIRMLGGDIVGMSSVPEAIVAHQCGMRIMTVSVVSNDTPENGSSEKTTIESVIATIQNSSKTLFTILEYMMVHFN
ncbi:MAG TPA: purine-nucleoside phosphorylase [Saprospiraceae bacterium]|nr:purine-nucleoside phosphorylase [Saprospiraceae bacterium]